MNSTFAAQLTGAGRAAVATIAVRGRHALAATMAQFRPARKDLKSLGRNRIHFGTWTWKQYSEELVVCRVDHDEIEIHCHGGHWAACSILNSLEEHGVQIISAREWTKRCEPDPFVREALEMLPRLRTKKAVRIALDQSRHAMRIALESIQTELAIGNIEAARQSLRGILAFAALGMRLEVPFRVVVMGPPNSGKSSLINALVGYDRAIVYDQPGTTRDIVSAETALDGWAIQLSDTAGIRATDDPVERAGINLAKQTIAQADLVLQIYDLSVHSAVQSTSDMAELPHKASLRVGTKADIRVHLSEVDVATSAVQKLGIESLGQQIVGKLIPHAPPPGSAVPLSASQQAALAEVLTLAEQHTPQMALEKLSDILRTDPNRC